MASAPTRRATIDTGIRFAVPTIRPSTVVRPRIIERIHAAVGNGLTVLQAPAGYGKTTALAAFAAEVEMDVRWISLDRAAATAEVFAELVGRALVGDDAWAPASAATPEDLRAYVSVAFSRREERSDLPLMLVFDNAHELRDAYDALDLLGWLMDAVPADTEIIISGREPVPLNQLDARIAGGECLFFGASDLAFTLKEVEELCTYKSSPIDPAAVLDATDGWPIAVMGIVSGTVALNDTREAIAGGSWERYVISHVWNTVPPEMRETLLRAAVPPTAEGGIMDALVPPKEWDALWRWMEEREFLCDRMGPRGLRLNPQLQHFLRSEYMRSDPDGAAECTRKVVTLLQGGDMLPDSLQLALDMECGDLLLDLMRQHARSLLLKGAFNLLWRAFNGIPSELVEAEPELEGIRLRVLAHAGYPEQALDQVLAFLKRKDLSPAARYHGLLAHIRCLRLLGPVEQLTRLFDQTRAIIDDTDPVLMAEFYWQESQSGLFVTAEYDRAARLLERSYQLAESSGAVSLALLARSARGQLLALVGDGPGAVEELSQAARGWRNLNGVANLCWVLNNLGMAHLQVGDYQSALETLEQARVEARRCENRRTEAFATASIADTHLALGNFEIAQRHYEQAVRLCIEEILDQTLAIYSLLGLAAAVLGQGNVSRADFLCQRALDMANDLDNPADVAACELQLAAVYATGKEFNRAELMARNALEKYLKIGSAGLARTARYRLALCQFLAGNRAEAEATLCELAEAVIDPWMIAPLSPLLRENPLFAQWAASRPSVPAHFKEQLAAQSFEQPAAGRGQPEGRTFPQVVAKSLGQVQVHIDGHEVSDAEWASARAKELFFVFLSSPKGLRKEEAVRHLYPDLPPSRCNSVFHSNLYRVRRALYKECVVKRDGAYLLNPEGDFEWDLQRFNDALAEAAAAPAGSPERARLYEEAIELYEGPFAPIFYSEWADTVRNQAEMRSLEVATALAGHYAGTGRYEQAARLLEHALELNPYNEEAAHQLALCRVRAGNTAAALSFIDEWARRIDQELGHGLPNRILQLRADIASGRAV